MNIKGLSRKWLESIKIYIEIIALFVTPGMQPWGTSRHFCIHIYIVGYLVIILDSRDLLHFIIYPFTLSHVHINFKHYYNHGSHLVFKYVFNDIGIGPLVMEHKIHQQRLCTLSKIIVVWHLFTVLFMIFNFKDDLLFIKILNILKQISCENKFIDYLNLKRLFIVKHFLKQ